MLLNLKKVFDSQTFISGTYFFFFILKQTLIKISFFSIAKQIKKKFFLFY